MKALLLAGVFAAGLVTALAGVAQADLIAYDPILYSPGALNLDGPVLGFAAPWAADPGVVVVAAGLSSPLALPSQGGAVAGDFNFQAPLVNLQAPAAGKEFWASFLLFHSGPNDETYMGLSPAGAAFGNPPSAGFGVRLGQYGIFVGGAFTPAPLPFTPNGSTDLLVAQFTASGAVWVVQLYVNKATFTVPDLVLNVPAVTYGTMVNLNETQFSSDEFRLGDTAADVAAVQSTPTHPSTWGRLKQLYR
ncbi:MAG TPA: hypothetical protein VL332_06400 [Candidatus Saccharimonadaceae bacterium]|jgi:hypothetical protein|nr:hypothetical protein [Candidatus Saccharimonadaceae bacterium]